MKTIVITGSTSGIGNALLKTLVRDNKVFAGYRNEKYVSDLERLGAIPFYIDMTRKDSIKLAAAYIKSKTDKIDVLVNVAGCVVAGVVENLDVDKIREQFEVNTFSHLDFTQRLLDLLDGGKIINISSMASFGIFPFVSPYCASKRSLDILFNSLANETRRNIKIISVKPGVIATPLWEKSIEGNKSSIENCNGYEKEMNFLVKNARQNGVKGLDVTDVSDLIYDIIQNENPRESYTVGIDAKMAQIVSMLPQGWQNAIIKFNLKRRVNIS